MRNFAALVLIALNVATGTTRADGAFSLPGGTFTDQARLTELATTLEQKQLSAAATLLDTLVTEDGATLMNGEGGTLVSVNAWLDALPRPQRQAMEAAYREKFEVATAQRLERLRHDPRATSTSLYAFATAHRFCAAGAAAYATAAERATDEGDLSAAGGMYALALHTGWVPDDAHAARIDLLRRLDDGALLPLPGEGSAKRPAPFAGPLPFDAAWFDGKDAKAARFVPVAADDAIFVSGPNGVAAFREGGQVVWSNTTPVSGSPTPSSHATTWEPAVLGDVYGRAHVVVTRQLATDAPATANRFVLRAWRATDGKPLWSSDAAPALKEVTFAGTPVVAGRSTYATGLVVQEGNERATLTLVALDTMDGSLRWQATLGSFSWPREAQKGARPWDGVSGGAAPLLAADAVYLTPGCGVVACVGRFDGRIRWLRPYESTEAPPLRWSGTPVLCGTVLVAAPFDSPQARGIDATTGRALWSVTTASPTLIGRTPTLALVAGTERVEAINVRDGSPSWTWQPVNTLKITGPAVVNGGQVLVPTVAPTQSIHADDGTLAQHEAPGVPFFRRTLNAEPVKRALEGMGAGKAFGAVK